jgi:chemotaxis protein histidine kinase CheA
VTLLCFFEEGRELIETICNEQSAPMDVRAPLHTLKGNAATLDLNLLANLCHHAESAIDEGSFGPLVISGLTERWSALEATLHLLLGRDGRDRLEVPRTELRSIVTRLRAGASTDEAAELLERLELRPLSQPLAYLGERAIELSRRLDRVEPTIRVDDHGLSGEPEQGAKVWTALVHLIRNAVDHGLERPDERRASGKAFPATLELGASREGSSVLIEVADDGKGIDWPRIQALAERRGLASASRADLTEALFTRALSTRDELSETSAAEWGSTQFDAKFAHSAAASRSKASWAAAVVSNCECPRWRLACIR